MSSFRQQRSASPRFIPFPGLAGQRGSSLLQQNQSGYTRSPSGSETDSVSTSTENLSHEERYAIRHTPRQEPQGQENISSGVSGSHCIQSGGPSSPILSSSCHRKHVDVYRVPNIRDFEESYHLNKSGPSSYHAAKSSSHTSGLCGGDSGQEKKGSGGREITEIPVDYLDQSQVLKHLAKEVTKIKCGRKSLDLAMSSPSSSSSSLSSSSPISLYPTSQKGEGQGEGQFGSSCGGGASGNTAWPKGRRGSSSEASAPFRGRRLHLSQSQPDLSQLGSAASRARDAAALKGSATNPRPRAKARDMLEWRLGLVSSTSGSGRQAGAGMIEQVFWPQLEMVEILVQENSALKLELEACFQKVAKSQKLEQEVGKVHRSHQELIESCERRERLEKAARLRLQQDIRRLQEMNHNLSAQLSILVASGGNNQVVGNDTSSSSSSLEMSSLRKELAERELLLAQLVTSNKELAACKERQEIELAAQRATLQEQRTHIDILDTALTNAQGNVVRLEEECRKKQMYVERVGQLQRALSSLQLASDRREQTERKLRTQLEREIRELRERDMNNESNKSDAKSGGNGGDMEKKGEGNINLEEEVRELRRQLREREERILAVEGELAQLERRCIQEGALRQAAIDAASIPKDAKIAALERTSQESERLVAEARSEKMRHMDEVHAAQRKVADLEARVKDLESRLAERDAMIRVLQKHTYEKDSAVAFLSSPHHTPHTSGLHSSSFHSGGGLHSSTLHGNALHANPLHSNSLHGNSYHGSSLHTGSLHGSSYHDSSVYRVAAAEILATTREELGSVSTASVFSTVNSSSGIGGSCDSSSGGNVSNLGGICSPGVGSGVGIGASSALRSVPFSSPSLNNATASSVVGGDAFVTGSVGSSTVVSASREGASSTTTSNCSFDDAKKSLDDQLKELDSQLLSKRALCCFPGLSNPGSQARKGAIPKPLLAGVAAPSRSLPPHLLFAAAGDAPGAGEEHSCKDKGRDGANDNSPMNSESVRLGSCRSGRSRAFVSSNVLEGIACYGSVGSGNGSGNSGGAGRSGSPSLVGFVPDILKGGGGGRYGMGRGGARREVVCKGVEGGSSGSPSEEIRLLEKQGISSQRLRKGEGEERGDGVVKKGRKGSLASGMDCQKDGTDGGDESSLVSHLPPRTGIPVPSSRRVRKVDGNQGGHRRRMVGGGAVVGVGSSSKGYGRLNEEEGKIGEGEGSVEGENGRRRSSSTSSVAGGGGSGKLHHLQPVPTSQPVGLLSSSRPSQVRPSQVVSKIRLFQGSGERSGSSTPRTGLPMVGKPSENSSPLLRDRIGGGKYRIQL